MAGQLVKILHFHSQRALVQSLVRELKDPACLTEQPKNFFFFSFLRIEGL